MFEFCVYLAETLIRFGVWDAYFATRAERGRRPFIGVERLA